MGKTILLEQFQHNLPFPKGSMICVNCWKKQETLHIIWRIPVWKKKKFFVDMAGSLTEMCDESKNFVKPDQDVQDDDYDEGEPMAKKKKVDATTTRKRTDFTLGKKHCFCGKFFETHKDKKIHLKSVHTDPKVWECTFVEGCEEKYENGKSLKRHIKCDHLKQFNHNCWYCDFGRDQESLVISHMVTDHGQQKKYPCSKEICAFSPRKVFPSESHRDKHEKYCGVAKQFECSHCGKKFARMKICNTMKIGSTFILIGVGAVVNVARIIIQKLPTNIIILLGIVSN